jgi:aspartate-semialdehyde dehydrogenase
MGTRTLAIVGATGAVGETMRTVLAERGVPASHLRLIASERSAGREIHYRGKPLPIRALEPEAFDGVELALFALGDDLAREWVPIARERGTWVVDNSSVYRMDTAVPLVVPDVNPGALAGAPGLVANPNCSTIIMVTALAPIARAAGIARLVGVTYQSASGAGADAVAELEAGTRALLDGLDPPREAFPVPLAFDCLPAIGRAMSDGSTREEWKMREETRRILDRPALRAAFTCVRVPTYVGHAVAVHLETETPLDAEAARALLGSAPGVTLGDGTARMRWPTPRGAAGRDDVLVGRVRDDGFGIAFWVVGDNLRRGAATNAVDIAEALLR